MHVNVIEYPDVNGNVVNLCRATKIDCFRFDSVYGIAAEIFNTRTPCFN